MNKSIIWRQYRDETKRTLPQKLGDMVKVYREKTGHIPTVIGLPWGYGKEMEKTLATRFKVQIVVPRWAAHEVWLGEEIDHRDAEKENEHASL